MGEAVDRARVAGGARAQAELGYRLLETTADRVVRGDWHH